jgi:hypothetical protein
MYAVQVTDMNAHVPPGCAAQSALLRQSAGMHARQVPPVTNVVAVRPGGPQTPPGQSASVAHLSTPHEFDKLTPPRPQTLLGQTPVVAQVPVAHGRSAAHSPWFVVRGADLGSLA